MLPPDARTASVIRRRRALLVIGTVDHAAARHTTFRTLKSFGTFAGVIALRAARVAVSTFFAVNGFVLGTWVVHIPAVERQTGVGHATLGWLLLLLGAGAFTGMQVAGPLTDRFGARRVVPLGAVACCASLVLPGVAAGPVSLGSALLVLGLGNGVLDVAMNAAAVQVEHGLARPVMSSFHAVFSLGGLLAALAGAGTQAAGWPAVVTFAVVAGLGVAGSAVATSALPPAERAVPAADAPAGAGHSRSRTPGRIWALAGLALLLMLCEGVANDWSALHLRDVLGAPAATAALAYGAFSVAMTAGRLLTDRVAARVGPVAVLRWGAASAAVGLTTVALTPWTGLALAGWTLFGIGLSGCVPQLFSAAGHADPQAAGLNVSRVAGLGYLGMLAGPAVVGALTHVVPLDTAFLLPALFCVVAAVAAGAARPARRPVAV